MPPYFPPIRRGSFLRGMRSDLELALWWVEAWQMSMMEQPSELSSVRGTSFGTLITNR